MTHLPERNGARDDSPVQVRVLAGSHKGGSDEQAHLRQVQDQNEQDIAIHRGQRQGNIRGDDVPMPEVLREEDSQASLEESGVMGLSKKHYGELNRPGVTQSRYDELRRLYAGDSVAQQQIDVYDPQSSYRPLWQAYRDALESGDAGRIEAAKRKLRKHYPDI